ncbi:hypothetical protein M885DRAFT_525598, partial [Pelagophyceae sp. CCMP2097]
MEDSVARERSADSLETLIVCPRGAAPGQTVLFRVGTARYQATVPVGVSPGQKFGVSTRPAPAVGDAHRRLGAFRPAAASTPDLHRTQRPSTAQSRRPTAAPSPRPSTAQSARPPLQRLPPRRPKLPDQGWWEQYGFKGGMSEEKKRDYGNGVPTWSPYHRSDEPETAAPPTGLPADAFWFAQYGFRTKAIEGTDDQMRAKGYGVPMWSPYFTEGGPGRDAQRRGDATRRPRTRG